MPLGVSRGQPKMNPWPFLSQTRLLGLLLTAVAPLEPHEPVRLCTALPTASGAQPPVGPDWVHEIKHDGFRILARRDERGVRLHGALPPDC
jgi:ATP-dependent DNA ligase